MLKIVSEYFGRWGTAAASGFTLCCVAGRLSTLATYFANALTSKETLFAVACTDADDRGQASIASMCLKDGVGWGEIYTSQPLRDLLNRYPSDARRRFIRPKYTGAGVLPTTNNATAMFGYYTEDASGSYPQITGHIAAVYCYNGDFYAAQNGGGEKVTEAGNGMQSLKTGGAAQTGYLVLVLVQHFFTAPRFLSSPPPLEFRQRRASARLFALQGGCPLRRLA